MEAETGVRNHPPRDAEATESQKEQGRTFP